eukprot:COSAG03_NODE_3552_length_1952_cov_4.583378_3_plen_156_part_00
MYLNCTRCAPVGHPARDEQPVPRANGICSRQHAPALDGCKMETERERTRNFAFPAKLQEKNGQRERERERQRDREGGREGENFERARVVPRLGLVHIGSARVSSLPDSVHHPAAAQADEGREARHTVDVGHEEPVIPPPYDLCSHSDDHSHITAT